MSIPHHLPLSRRGFIRRVAVAAGALTAGQLLVASTEMPLSTLESSQAATLERLGGRPGLTQQEPLRLGVLLPRSSAYSMLGPDVLAGMRLYTDQRAARPFELVTEQIGAGQSEAQRGALKLLDQHRVDLLAGVLSPTIAASLRGALAERRTALVVADLGANLVRASESSPLVAYSSLGHWRASHALGAWAAQHVGRRAVIATSFYDGGYDTIYAFRLGFEAAGGQILDTFVSHRPTDAGDHMSQTLARIAAARPDMVYAMYSGREDGDFARAYAEAGLSGKLPLLSLQMLAGPSGAEMQLAMSWSPSLGSAENRAFMAAYQAAAGRAPNSFSVLGYDTAQLIDTAVASAGDHRDLLRLQEALGQVAFASPRGAVAMDPQTRSLSAPIYLSAGGRVAAELLDAAPALLEATAALHASAKTGWTNAYLCV